MVVHSQVEVEELGKQALEGAEIHLQQILKVKINILYGFIFFSLKKSFLVLFFNIYILCGSIVRDV